MASQEIGDDLRWAEAQSLLERVPTPSAEERLRRARRLRWLVLVIVGAVLAAVAVAVTVLLRDAIRSGRPDDVPTWQVVAGFILAGVGLVIQLAALVVLLRSNRRLGAYRSPLFVLTRAQRKELLSQVRGRRPVDPEHLPLACYLAETLLAQRLSLLSNAGLIVAFTGLWVADPSSWRLVLLGFMVLPWVVLWPLFHRQSRQARQFLALRP